MKNAHTRKHAGCGRCIETPNLGVHLMVADQSDQFLDPRPGYDRNYKRCRALPKWSPGAQHADPSPPRKKRLENIRRAGVKLPDPPRHTNEDDQRLFPIVPADDQEVGS